MNAAAMTRAECEACIVLVAQELAATKQHFDTAVAYEMNDHVRQTRTHIEKSTKLLEKLQVMRDAAL